MVGFCTGFGRIFGNGLKAPGTGDGSGKSKAAAPVGAPTVAGIVRHRVTLSSAGQRQVCQWSAQADLHVLCIAYLRRGRKLSERKVKSGGHVRIGRL